MILETGYDEKNTSMYGIIVMMILINCLMEELYYGWIMILNYKRRYMIDYFCIMFTLIAPEF